MDAAHDLGSGVPAVDHRGLGAPRVEGGWSGGADGREDETAP